MSLTDSKPDGPNKLTQQEAELRRKQISSTNVEYKLKFSLGKKRESYTGTTEVRFTVDEHASDIFLDFVGSRIDKFLLNDADLIASGKATWESNRLFVKRDALANGGGANVLTIDFESKYSHDGAGLHHFNDPEDGQEYLYTNFEPFEAHKLFPCFDQPDIKATYAVEVTAPSEWHVVANYPETASAPVEGAAEPLTHHQFELTKPFSTYLMALVMGPFDVVTDKYKDMPLRIFCRKTMTKYLDHAEFFEITKQGLGFYEDYFDFPFPFAKYDQCIVPEFNMGAMENVGCVTFYERTIFTDPPTEKQRCDRADIILHEMAHMWFGNLVTMSWWDGLWLNESFATYMAALAVASATRFGDASWLHFNTSMKHWAYTSDELSTTHPITGTIADTDATFLNFDGITYGKGACVLKQLVAKVSKDKFRDSIRGYFKKHAWGNTTHADFLASIEAGSGHDLHKWSRDWLETSGLNTLVCRWHNHGGGNITSFEIEQTPSCPDHPTLREHTTEIILINEDGAQRTHSVVVPEQETLVVAELCDQACPAFVYPNHNDNAYAKVRLDGASTEYARANLGKILDPLLRQQVYASLWSMMRDADTIRSTEYVQLVIDQCPLETNMALLSSILNKCSSALSYYVPDCPQHESLSAAAFKIAWQMLNDSACTAEGRIIWMNACISFAQSADKLAFLIQLLDVPSGAVTLDQQQRWAVIRRMAAYGIDGWEERLQKEKVRDASDRGVRAEQSVLAAVPTAENKAAMWQRYLTDRESPSHVLAHSMGGFWWVDHQKELLEPYVDRFFADIRQIMSGRANDSQQLFCNQLTPLGWRDSDRVGKQAQQLLDALAPEDQILRRQMQEVVDDTKRFSRVRAKALEP